LLNTGFTENGSLKIRPRGRTLLQRYAFDLAMILEGLKSGDLLLGLRDVHLCGNQRAPSCCFVYKAKHFRLV
jgi:hypothetical protein